ncbi:MAG TPA: aminotransferase class V-fold PLP-dependent enzyme [Polyangia bacterium]|nr:aminotransferase class V-fold PLP-dependent enzyme [Polyangia bacterium]
MTPGGNDEIYLDNAATTRPWPEVVEAVRSAMGEGFGNASSPHRRGLAAARLVRRAVDEIRAAVGGGDWNVVFTSGGSEADGFALLGSAPRGKRDAVVYSGVEHAAVEETAAHLAVTGCRAVRVAAGYGGVVDPGELAAAADERTAVVALTHVANELGTVQPVAEAARQVAAASPRALFHVDAVQALAQLERLDYPREVGSVALSAHKIHGPQGIGALLLRPTVRPRPLLLGGGQQDGLRSGTLNVPGIAGFGVAASLLTARRAEGVRRMRALADELAGCLVSAATGVRLLGDPAARAPGILVIAVGSVESEVLLHALVERGVLASAGAACHSTRKDPPRSVVEAGLGRDEGVLRLSLSFDTTGDEIQRAAAAFTAALASLRRPATGRG